MSIHNIIHKIKENIGLDKITILYLFIILLVGFSSFGLGRISVDNKINDSVENQNITNNEISLTQPIQSTEKRYVASKNGKMYYSLGCSGAKRINLENEVWFSTSEDAEKSGYTLSSTCK